MTLESRPTPVRYAHSDAQVLPPTHRMASSTVSFMTKTHEAINVIQPRLDSFTQPQSQQVQHIGQYVHSDTVYSDPASENRNRYAKAKEQPTRHAVRRSTQEHRERPDLHHLSDLETSDSARPSTDQRSLRGLRLFNPILAPAPNLATVTNQRAVSYTHLTLPTIYSV